jgi:hexokinase
MQEILREFALTDEQLLYESGRVAGLITDGLRGGASPFLLIPSFLDLPDGQEQGEFFALDFGGSNLRLARIRLDKGSFLVNALAEWPLSALMPTGRNGRTEDLFYSIAREITLLAGNQGGLLGHTFSYPVIQTGVNTAVLQNWTKEVALTGEEKVDINGLLRQKLRELGRIMFWYDLIRADVLAIVACT